MCDPKKEVESRIPTQAVNRTEAADWLKKHRKFLLDQNNEDANIPSQPDIPPGLFPTWRTLNNRVGKHLSASMKRLSDFEILPQPNETTCGPTCLHAVFRYFGDNLDLDSVIAETPALEDGGTLAVLLGTQAIERGYHAKIFTYNLRVFDPSWFVHPSSSALKQTHPIDCPDEKVPSVDLVKKLNDQIKHKESIKLKLACKAYSHFIKIGGEIRMHDLNKQLMRQYFSQSIPILTGLSSTYLYQSARERQRDMKSDDIRGTPTGHFVVLCGETPARKLIRVADPYVPNPFTKHHYYDVTRDRLICAILLGVLTYDANLLIIKPKPDF